MTTGIDPQLRRGVVEYCALGLLAQEPMYGWQLSASLTEHGLIGSIGTLYPLLARLRGRGLVRTFEGPSTNGPARKYYELTAAGEAELAAFRAQWGEYTRTVTEIIEGNAP